MAVGNNNNGEDEGQLDEATTRHSPAVNSISVSEKQAKSLVDLLASPVGSRSADQIQQIKRCLKNVRFFQDYQDSENYVHVLQNLELERKSQDSILFREKDVADKFFIILTGQIGLYIAASAQPSSSSNQQKSISSPQSQFQSVQSSSSTINTTQINISQQSSIQPDTNQLQGSALTVKAKQHTSSSNDQLGSSAIRSFGIGVKEIAQLESGDAFGEIGLLYNQERTATAICLIPTTLLVLRKHIFDKYLSQRKNTKVSTMIEFYESIWLLHSLSQQEIRSLATKTVLNHCTKHTIIIRQGETPKGVYFVRKGIVKIIVSLRLKIDANDQFVLDAHGQPLLAEGRLNETFKTIDVQVDEIGNGSIFADYEVYSNKKIEYTAVAGTFCEILTINLTDFKMSIPDDIFTMFTKSVKHYPSHEAIKKQYLENLAWSSYKNDVIHSFNAELVNRVRTQKINEHRMPFLPKVSLDKYSFYDEPTESNAASNIHKKRSEFGNQLDHVNETEADIEQSNGTDKMNKSKGEQNLKQKLFEEFLQKKAQHTRWKSSGGESQLNSNNNNSNNNKPINPVYQTIAALKKASISLFQSTASMQKIPGEFTTDLQQELNELLSKKGVVQDPIAAPSHLRQRSVITSNREAQQNKGTTTTTINPIGKGKGIDGMNRQQSLTSLQAPNSNQKSTKLIKRGDALVSSLKLPILHNSNSSHSMLTNSKQILPIIKQSSKTARLAMEIY